MNLFPEIKPYKIEFLKVDDHNELYIEQVGNPNGIPIIFLHGGPGAGLSNNEIVEVGASCTLIPGEPRISFAAATFRPK